MQDHVTEVITLKPTSSSKRRATFPTIPACPTWPVPRKRPMESVLMSIRSARLPPPAKPVSHYYFLQEQSLFAPFVGWWHVPKCLYV